MRSHKKQWYNIMQSKDGATQLQVAKPRPVTVEQHEPKAHTYSEVKFMVKFFEKDAIYKLLRRQVHRDWKKACEITGISPNELYLFPGDLEKPEHWTDYEKSLNDWVDYTKAKLFALSVDKEKIMELLGVYRDQQK